jgi:histone demethylase JARID1
MQIPEALQILKRAKDEDFRSRPSYAQVCWLDEEIYEMQLSEQDKASPTPPFELQKLRKLHEDWMRKGLNLFGKADASLHVLKSHLEFVLKRNARCLNIGSDTETSPSRDEKLVCICRSIEVGRMVTCGLCLER